MFGALALSNQDHFRPEGFWRAFKDYDGEPINVREHQDAYEFFTRLQARTRAPSATGGPVLRVASGAPHACKHDARLLFVQVHCASCQCWTQNLTTQRAL